MLVAAAAVVAVSGEAVVAVETRKKSSKLNSVEVIVKDSSGHMVEEEGDVRYANLLRYVYATWANLAGIVQSVQTLLLSFQADELSFYLSSFVSEISVQVLTIRTIPFECLV